MHVLDAAAKAFSGEVVPVRMKKTRQTIGHMLPHSPRLWERVTSIVRTASDVASHRKKSALADEADDVLCRLQRLFGDDVCAFRAVDQDLIDMAGICRQPLHLR